MLIRVNARTARMARMALMAIGLSLAAMAMTAQTATTTTQNNNNPNSTKPVKKPTTPPPTRTAPPPTKPAPPKLTLPTKDETVPRITLPSRPATPSTSDNAPRSNGIVKNNTEMPRMNGSSNPHPPVDSRATPYSAPPAAPYARPSNTAATDVYRPVATPGRSFAPVIVHPAATGIMGRPAPMGTRPLTLTNGNAIQRRANGQVSDVFDKQHAMSIHNGLNGGRTITMVRPNGVRIVATGVRTGYVEKPFTVGGNQFTERTITTNGITTHQFYRPTTFQGVPIHVYTPVHYYPPATYGWVYHAPVLISAAGAGLVPVAILPAGVLPPGAFAGPDGGLVVPGPSRFSLFLSNVSGWLTSYVTCMDPWGMGQLMGTGMSQLAMGPNGQPTGGGYSAGGQNPSGGGQQGNPGGQNPYAAPQPGDQSGQNPYAGGQPVNAAGPGAAPPGPGNSCPQNANANAAAGNQNTPAQTPPGNPYAGNQGQQPQGQYAPTGNPGASANPYGADPGQPAQGQNQTAQIPPGAGGPAAGPVLSPDVQQQVANEIKNQVALENAEAAQNAQGQTPDPASSGVARMLGDGQLHVFVVDNPIDVVDASGAECALGSGDVLKTIAPPAPTDTTASLTVLASSSNECVLSDSVAVNFADLQEMQNHMRQMIDQGLDTIQQNQGQPGVPAAPPAAAAATAAPATFAPLAPPPDPNATAEVSQQNQQANQSVAQVAAQAPPQ